MTDFIEVRGLEVMGIHGVYDYEKERPQPFVVDLTISLDLRPAHRSDDLGDTVSYSVFVNEARAVVEGDSVDLIETLAERIAQAVLAYQSVEAVEVAVRKPRAPVNAVIESVGVRIFRP